MIVSHRGSGLLVLAPLLEWQEGFVIGRQLFQPQPPFPSGLPGGGWEEMAAVGAAERIAK